MDPEGALEVEVEVEVEEVVGDSFVSVEAEVASVPEASRPGEESDEDGEKKAEWNSRATPTCYKWHQLDPGEGPATRGRHTVGIDTVRGVLVMFGGQNYDLRRKYNDIAKFDLNTDRWHSVSEHDAENNVPCPRSSHASIATKDALYIFGGATGKSFMASPGCCKDASTWRYSFTDGSWQKVEAKGLDAVSSRYGHTTVLTPGDVVYLFGGMTDSGCDWNTFRIDLVNKTVERLECSFVGSAGDVCGPFPNSASLCSDTWTHPVLDDGKKRSAQQVRDCVRGFGHTAIYNPFTDSMYVLGGTVDGRNYHSTFLRLDLKTRRWMLEESLNKPPEGRYVHCASFDENRNAMYVFGGYCGTYRNDVHEYDFNTKKWAEIKPHPSSPEGPCLRSGACSVVWKDHVYIFGGCDDNRYYNDVWKLRLWNDTISLKETMLDWVAWQQAKGDMDVIEASSPLGITDSLRRRKEEFGLIVERVPRSSKREARM
eukprot:TRINITY_DN19724_c0_g1_i1.p1 TRINITY_DN19724_c0_g1~~TRINITY_DN19724_c0_g1_i1.p1  ORF type:complete len:484 (+),score=105.46 TRINITY_DN19724_c0_g1_i1:35-1486(+)